MTGATTTSLSQGSRFDADDLAANREGELSPRQVAMRRRSFRMVIVIAVVFVAIGVAVGWVTRTSDLVCGRYTGCDDPGRDVNDLVQFLVVAVPSSGLGGLLVFVGWRQMRQEIDAPVTLLVGDVEAATTAQWGPHRVLRVGPDQRVKLPDQAAGTMQVGARYGVYHQGNRLLSYEERPHRANDGAGPAR